MSKASRERQNKQVPNVFYQQKWFKLIFILCLFGWLFYESSNTFQIDKDELVQIRLTVKGETRSGARNESIRLRFQSKEYPCKFGIYVGGTFGRWTEVKDALADGETVTVKIHEYDKDFLNGKDIVMVYYLESAKSGLIFNEDDFNSGEKSHDRRWLIVLAVIFVYLLYRFILRD